jgi:signal peptidase I
MAENEIKDENIALPFIVETKELPETLKDENSIEAPVPDVPPETPKTKLSEIIDFCRDLIIIFIVVIFVRTYLAAPFQISGSSMEESYHDGEFILVNKFSYADFLLGKVGDPVRGDVVILRPHAANGKEYYIKRVVGMPGDTVKFEGGNVFLKQAASVDFIKLDEGYLSIANKGKTFLPMDVKDTEFIVPSGQYFTMGDNRNNSSDSRSCFMSCSVQGSTHFVSRENIVGKLFVDFGYINIFRE